MDFRFHHVAIQSTDLEKSFRFYHQILEMPLLKRETSRKGRAIIWLAAGEGRVELYGGKPGQALRPAWEPDGVGPISIGLLVKELDRTVERLRSAGVTILKPPYEPVPGERAAMVAGPDAEEIVLLEKPVS